MESKDQHDHSVRRLPARLYEAAHGLPPVTGALLAAICVVFVLETLAGGASNANTLIAFGASLRPYFLDGQYWRLVVPMFIHLSIAHLLLNAAALFIFGPPLERVYGGRRFALIYLASGMSGSLASMMLSRELGAGASGAIMGVCGALAVTGYTRPEVLSPELRPKCREQMLGAIALTLAVGVWIPHIDNWAHLGGLTAGAGLTLVLPPASALDRAEPPVGWSLILPLCVVCFSMASAVNYYGLNWQIRALETTGRHLLSERHVQAATRSFQEAGRLANEAVTLAGWKDPNFMAALAGARSGARDVAAAASRDSFLIRQAGGRPSERPQ